MGTVIVGALVAAAVALAARSVYKSKKKGGCGCGCDGCEKSGSCNH